MHGRETCSYCDGGQSCHINLQEDLSKEQYLKIIDYATSKGVNYFLFNLTFPYTRFTKGVNKIATPIGKGVTRGAESVARPVRNYKKIRK